MEPSSSSSSSRCGARLRLRPRVQVPTDLLAETSITTPAPTPDEREELEELARGPVQNVADYAPPAPRQARSFSSAVPDWALGLLAAIVLLAAVEWWGARRWLPGS